MQQFSQHNHNHQSRVQRLSQNGAKRIVVVKHPPQLDQQMTCLRVMCHHLSAHPVPLVMKFIGQGTSHNGQPMAIYACPFAGCQFRQGWVRDRNSGKPICLWKGKHQP